MSANEAPELDGFIGYFYKQYWKIFKGSVMAAIQHFFSRGFLLKLWKATFMTDL